MSKKELAEQNHAPLAVVDGGGRGWDVEGIETADLELPRVVIHQGDIAAKEYGDHPKGTLVNSLTLEALPSNRFVPIGIGYKEYVGWDGRPGDVPPLYRTRCRADVPPAHLEWNDDDRDNKPRCLQQVYFLVIFEQSDFPIAIRISLNNKKRRGAVTVLHQFENARAAKNRPRGVYRLESEDSENDKGRWKDPKIVPAGDASGDLLAAANNWYDMLSTRNVIVSEHGGEGGYDPELDG